MERTCIICRTSKDRSLFNIEHVFPAAIGGVFTTDLVCSACNTILNQKVDEPFVKSNWVLAYRHTYNLNRDSKRSIPNLVKGTVKNAEGADALVKMENGQLKSEVLDQFKHEIDENGKVSCTLSIDASKVDDIDSIIRSNLERLSKKLEINKGTDYTILSKIKTENKSFYVTLNVPDNLLIKQAAKIAYEVACMTTPNYLLDDFSHTLSEFLTSDTISPELHIQFDNVGTAKFQKYKDRFKVLSMPLHHHAILIDNVQNEGVYAAVKIFNYIYPVLLTRKTESFPPEEFLLVNDAVEKSLSCNHLLNYRLIDCKVDLKNLTEKRASEVRSTGIRVFEVINNSWAFYNHLGKKKYDNINALCISVIQSENLMEDLKTGIVYINLENKNTFIKTIDGTLVQILNLGVKSEILMQSLV